MSTVVQPVLPRDEHIRNPANQALLVLAVLTVLPLFVYVPVSFNVVITASVCVFVGCWRSVKEEPPADSMSQKVRRLSLLTANHTMFNTWKY